MNYSQQKKDSELHLYNEKTQMIDGFTCPMKNQPSQLEF